MAEMHFSQNIRYVPINESYCYGILDNVRVVIDTQHGTFNATKLCEACGRRFHDWMRTRCARELLVPKDSSAKRGDIVDINGTYVPRKVLVVVAGWISTEICSKIQDIVVDYYLTSRIQPVQIRLDQMTAVAAERTRQLEVARTSLRDVNPKPIRATKRWMLGVLETSDRAYPYTVIRRQRGSYRRAIRKAEKAPTYVKELVRWAYCPGPVTALNRAQEAIDFIEVKNNRFRLLKQKSFRDFFNEFQRINAYRFVVEHIDDAVGAPAEA